MFVRSSGNVVTGEETRENYIAMINKIRETNPNAEIVFVVVARIDEVRAIEGAEDGFMPDFILHMLDLADEYDIPVIDPMSALYDACVEKAGEEKAWTDGWKEYVTDDVHPYERGEELYGNVIWAYIKEALK